MQKKMTVVDGYVVYFIYLCNMVAQGQDYVQHNKNRLEDKNRNKDGSKNHSKLFATISPYSRE